MWPPPWRRLSIDEKRGCDRRAVRDQNSTVIRNYSMGLEISAGRKSASSKATNGPSARLFHAKGAQMLRQVTSTLTACALASLVSVSAQEPPAAQQQPPAQQQQQQQPQQQPKETLTGCVMEAKTTDGATVYVLNNVEGGSAAMYLLAGPAQSEMAGNVNKKVEVTGPVQQPSAPSDAAAANPKELRPPAMQVESVKVVAESCK
jgi:hypothetical protein